MSLTPHCPHGYLCSLLLVQRITAVMKRQEGSCFPRREGSWPRSLSLYLYPAP